MEENDRYDKAIVRNLYEIAHALMELKALTALENYCELNNVWVLGASFFSIAEKALFNDMVAHTIKVLEKNRESTTFWYLLKGEVKIEELKVYSSQKINFLEDLSNRFKIIRNKTHFHIDKNGVLDTNKIWEEAGIKRKDVKSALEFIFLLLEELHEKKFNRSFLFNPADYDNSDIGRVLDIVGKEGLLNIYPKAAQDDR